jgi:hypothetical protein
LGIEGRTRAGAVVREIGDHVSASEVAHGEVFGDCRKVSSYVVGVFSVLRVGIVILVQWI